MDEVLKFPKKFLFFKFVDQMAENWFLSLKWMSKSAKLLNCVFMGEGEVFAVFWNICAVWRIKMHDESC